MFGQYSKLLKNKRIPFCLKQKLFKMVILLLIKYGAETWTLKKRQQEKLAASQ